MLGAFLTAREAARRLSKSSGGAGGSIVLMSSAAARLGSPNLYIDYAASKGAIDTLTMGLAKELGPEGSGSTAFVRASSTPKSTRVAASPTGQGSGRDRSAGPPGLGRGDLCGGVLADQRRGFLRDRCAARRLRRALTAASSNFARRSRPRAGSRFQDLHSPLQPARRQV